MLKSEVREDRLLVLVLLCADSVLGQFILVIDEFEVLFCFILIRHKKCSN